MPPASRASTRKRLYRLRRGAVRVLTLPASRLREGPIKVRVRRMVLRWQHSLPANLAVNPGDVVVQVGTPNRETVSKLARCAGPRGRLVVVEAMPINRARLADHVRERGLSNVVLIGAAACNETGRGVLRTSPIKGDHRLAIDGVEIDNDHRPENAEMGEVEVDFVRLDDALPEAGIEHIDFLSVTVNGAEAEVIRGARALLSGARPGSRVYAKGHAIDHDGRPIHVTTQELMREMDYQTVISRGESSPISEWGQRAGDLYAWR